MESLKKVCPQCAVLAPRGFCTFNSAFHSFDYSKHVGFPVVQVNSLQEAVHCGCHEKVPDVTSKKARNKLIIACILALFFMIGEIVGECLRGREGVKREDYSTHCIYPGGYLSQSLAILTDAAHMLSDFASFLISLFAIWVATRKPSKGMSFGWHRAGLYIQ